MGSAAKGTKMNIFLILSAASHERAHPTRGCIPREGASHERAHPTRGLIPPGAREPLFFIGGLSRFQSWLWNWNLSTLHFLLILYPLPVGSSGCWWPSHT